MLLFILAEHAKATIEDIMGHVDVENPHFFEEADFVQLIAKVFRVLKCYSLVQKSINNCFKQP